MFEHIIGNNKNKELLKEIVQRGNISHSYIFSGTEGIGKYLFAKEFAKGILCLDENNKPCSKCKSCLEIEGGNNPDFLEINSDGSSIKIEQIRDMNKSVLEKPIVGARKVYIINDSQQMTKEAQNALLKTLEEPPEYVHIILISSNDNMFLSTIKSRCIKISFNKLTDDEMKKIVPDVSDNLLKIANGSVRRAMDMTGKESMYELLFNTFNNLENTNIIDLLKFKDSIFKDKEDVSTTLEYVSQIFFDLVKDNLYDDRYIKCIEIIESTKDRLKKNSNFDMTIDRMLIKTWEAVNE